jgi:hypothetical protein
LKEVGYVDGRNVEIEYRFAEGHDNQLPALAADLVRHRVAVIAVLVNPADPRRVDAITRNTQAAAHDLKLQLEVRMPAPTTTSTRFLGAWSSVEQAAS